MCHRMESQCEVTPKGYTENMVTAIDPSGFKGLKTWERGDCGGQSSELRPPDEWLLIRLWYLNQNLGFLEKPPPCC